MLSFIESGKTRYVTQDNISEGVDAKDVADVAEQFGVSQKVISDILGVSIRAVQNKRRAKDNEKLGKNVSERLLRLREVMSVAVNYFGSDDGARHWFNTPNIGLGNKPPLLLCDTFLGMDRVENSIQKLMHGMTA
jgi:putative toxin-antitoxin system antitoxin component (TIGR02293 family)